MFPMCFDDFDITRQSDEDICLEQWFNDFCEWFDSQISPYKVYEVDCDDGTRGDLIYIMK